MTTATQPPAHDPVQTLRAQLQLLMEPPGPPLLIDGDDMIVINTLDRTDNPAVLITGNNNTFINHTGATLTGTGSDAGFFDPSTAEAAVEISGTGNHVENRSGATIAGTVGIFSSGADTSIVNDGDILAFDPEIPSFDDSTGLLLGDDSSVLNRGLIRAEARSVARTIVTGDRATVQNVAVVEASGDFVLAIQVGSDSTVVNTGTVDVTARLNAVAMTTGGSGSTQENFGTIRASVDAEFGGNAFGIATGFGGIGNTIVNAGTIEVTTAGRGSAQGIFASGSDVENRGMIAATETNGTAAAQSIGVFLVSATGSNAGSIAASAANGASIALILSGNSAFANSGDMLATGPSAFGASTAGLVVLTNTGSITASAVGAGNSVVLDLGDDASLGNLGLLRAESGGQATGIEADDRTDL